MLPPLTQIVDVALMCCARIGGVQFQLTRRAGRLTLSAEDLLSMALARTHFEIVAAYAPARTRRLVQGATAEDLVRSTRLTIAPEVQSSAPASEPPSGVS